MPQPSSRIGLFAVGLAELFCGERAVPADVVAAALVLVIVERGVFVVLARAGGERGGEPLVKGHRQ